VSARDPDSGAAGLSRAQVAARTRAVLSRGGPANPDVLLVDAPSGPVVVKDFAPRRGLVRRRLGPWLLRREERAYRRLAGVAAVPRFLGWLDRAAIVLEYRPGTFLSRSLAGRVPGTFLAELDAAIDEMHRRGVVHLDLRHRSNLLAGEDGRPIVIDFASALLFDASKPSGRLGVRIFAALDRRALRKWRVRLS